MAQVNFFSRVGNLFKGFLSLFIKDIERDHPEIAYENAINGMTEKYSRLKTATAAIIRRRDEMRRRLDAEQRSLAEVNQDLQGALAMNDAELGGVLIQKKEAIEAALNDLMHEAQQAEGEADDAKAALLNVKSEIMNLKAEKDRMLAKMQSADARLKIQEQLEGLSVEADVQALDTVREHIKTTIAEADLGKELNKSDLDTRLADLRKKSGSITAQKKFEALQQQMSEGSGPQKTL